MEVYSDTLAAVAAVSGSTGLPKNAQKSEEGSIKMFEAIKEWELEHELKGKLEGERKGKLELAQALYNDNMPIEKIAELAKLPVATLKKHLKMNA
jgi:hypothetical protein